MMSESVLREHIEYHNDTFREKPFHKVVHGLEYFFRMCLSLQLNIQQRMTNESYFKWLSCEYEFPKKLQFAVC